MLSWIGWSPSEFVVPGCYSISFGNGFDYADFMWSFSKGDSGTVWGWPNGGTGCIDTSNPYLYGTYTITYAENSDGTGWVYSGSTLTVDAP